MKRGMRRPLGLAAAVMLVVAGIFTVGVPGLSGHSQSLAAGNNVDWPLWGNNSDNDRYSSLNQINASNVNKLGYAWTMSAGHNQVGWEAIPVEVGGTLYLTTSSDEVYALDAATGKLKWKYTPAVDFFLAISGGGGGVPANRGVTVANGKVYELTFDNQLIALQAATGERLWDSRVADPHLGYSETSPPTFWNGELFVGSAESDAGLRGFVAAYNANTGKQLWRYYTVPAPGQGWMPAQGQHGGGDVWMPITVDTTTGIVYFGTGNPSPDEIVSIRKGCDPHVDSLVALDAKSGKFLWARNEMCPDAWDYDSMPSPMLFNIKVNGKTVRAVGHANKAGVYHVYNAKTGQPISTSQPIVPQTTPRPFPTAKGVKVCPGAIGGVEYPPPSYSPQTNAVYQPGLEVCMKYTTEPMSAVQAHQRGQIDFGGDFVPVPPFYGMMAAINVSTGKFLWKEKMPVPMTAGSLATGGNLVFAGADDGNLYAFDAKNGKILWKGHVGLPFGAPPITYEVNGTQYIAIASGSSTSVQIGNPAAPVGAQFAVFKLNGSKVHSLAPVKASPAVSQSTINALLKGTTPLGKYMHVNAGQKRVVLDMIAASDNSNSGFNFDGYSKGKGNWIIPQGWTVDVLFSNKSRVPHSLALASAAKPNPPLPIMGLAPVETPNAVAGTPAGITEHVGFATAQTGSYYWVCLVPGHIQSGMWDKFTVSSTAKMPSIS